MRRFEQPSKDNNSIPEKKKPAPELVFATQVEALVRERASLDDRYALLNQQAEQLMHIPDPEKRTSVGYIDPESGERVSIEVPFTKQEIDAILPAIVAHEFLTIEGAKHSSPERDYWLGAQLMPTRAEELAERGRVIWGVVTAAHSAKNAVVIVEESAEEVRGQNKKLFERITQLPDQLRTISLEEES